MTPDVLQALESDRTIDITTIGRKTGQLRRKEIWFHNLDGCLYITGLPGSRDWYSNLMAQPEFIFHLKESVTADLPAVATPVLGDARRRQAIAGILSKLGWDRNLEDWVANSPLVEVQL